MSQVYVNEKTGADSTDVSGSEQQPFQTPAFALFKNEDAKILVYKQLEDSEEFGYGEISASALKKAKKGAEGLKKKQKNRPSYRKNKENIKMMLLKNLQKWT